MAAETVPAGAGPAFPVRADALLPEFVPPAGGPVQWREVWRSWVYEGQRADLLALGLMPAQTVFPGDLPGRRRCTFTTPAGRRGTIARVPRLGPQGFAASVYFNGDDRAREQAKQSQRRHNEAVAKAAAETRERMERMKHSAEDFRADAVQTGEWFLPIIMKTMQGEQATALGGYLFDEDTRRQVAHHIESINRLIRDGRVMFDPGLGDCHRQWCAQPLREADPGFAAVLARLCHSSGRSPAA